MVYFKSSFKNLISIYVSVFLVFSPLHEQTNDNLEEDAFSDEKKKYKLTMISGSEVMFDSFVRLSGDSLLIASNQFEQYIAIGLIEDIAIPKESHAIKKGAKIGVVTGAVVGGFVGYGVAEALRSHGFPTPVAGLVIAIGAAIGGVGSAVVGTIIGGIFRIASGNKYKTHDMTGWSVAQKKDKIREIMNSE